MIPRSIINQLVTTLQNFPACGLIGSRQVGKTTLAKTIAAELKVPLLYLDLELPSDKNKLTEPEIFLSANKEKLIILDEIHRVPELFPILRSLIDQDRRPGRFLITGSASPNLLRQSSESLAGRIVYLELTPFHYRELQNSDFQTHWLRGGFPSSYLEKNDSVREVWLRNYISNYAERDLRELGMPLSSIQSIQLMRMLAGINGSILNMSSLSKSMGVTSTTTKRYIDFLEQTFFIRLLPSFHTNTKKRLVKAPKVLVRDSGLLHSLNGIETVDELYSFAGVGHSWESYVIQQIIANLQPKFSPHFYRTQDGSEIDLLIVKGDRPMVGIEIKLTNSPTLTKGNTIAMEDLKANNNFVVTPSADDYLIQRNVQVCSIKTIWKYLEELEILT